MASAQPSASDARYTTDTLKEDATASETKAKKWLKAKVDSDEEESETSDSESEDETLSLF